MKRLLTAFAALTFLCCAASGGEVEYPAGSVTAKGYLAKPAEAGGKKLPGVLVVHEWWGHNSYARKRADMLAEQGYYALAIDMYGDGKTAEHPKDAGAFAKAVRDDRPEGAARFAGAAAFLRAQEGVDGGRIAAIGYCFGGSVVLQMAVSNVADLRAVGSFHGSLNGVEFPAEGPVGAKLLVFHGAADPFIPQAHVDQFKTEVARVGADLRFEAYEGASHSFTDPGADGKAEEFDLPIGYHEEADKASWKTLLEELGAAFKK